MTCLNSPYLEIFRQIETVALARALAPHEAYEMFDLFLVTHGLDPVVYLSMAITSGGYRRDPDLPMGDVISRNSVFGQLAALALIRDIPELDLSDIIVPSELGKVTRWDQMDFLLFWFHVIAGLRPHEAAYIEGVVQEKINSRALSDTESPKCQYDRLVSDYKAAMCDLVSNTAKKLHPNNIQAVIFILDGEMSLGAQAEQELCYALGIPPQMQLLSAHAVATLDGEYAQHLIRLRTLGASALGTSVNTDPQVSFLGYSIGEDLQLVDQRSAIRLGCRKTSLLNAILTKEYYAKRPGAQPTRHCGHRPLITIASSR